MEKNYRLEFNETQQMFHLDNFTHEANSHGWVEISPSEKDSKASAFIDYIERRYEHSTENPITVKAVKDEWYWFEFILNTIERREQVFVRLANKHKNETA